MTSSNLDIVTAKHLFVDTAREICPGFTVRYDHRQALNDITLWALRSPSSALDLDKGLFLHGDIGTGKSTLLQILALYLTRVSSSPYRMRITNCVDVCGGFAANGVDALQTFVDWRLQAFDELGREPIPASHFGTSLNVMEYLLQRRYDRRRSGLTFVTSNFAPDQLADLYGKHIADRARQLFNFITLDGPSFRR